MRPDLKLLDQYGSGRVVKLYAPLLHWSNFYEQKNTKHVGLCTKQTSQTDNYVVATANRIFQVRYNGKQ